MILRTHIRRIGHDDVIPLRQRLSLIKHPQHLPMRFTQKKLPPQVFRLNSISHKPQAAFIQARLNQRAEGLRLLKLAQQLEQALVEQVANAEGVDVVVEFIPFKLHVLQLKDPGPHQLLWLEEPPRLLPCFEHQGELGELGGARADLQADQVVPQDQGGDFAGRVALFGVDQAEQIKGIGEHVPAAAGGIEQLDLFGLGDPENVRFGFALDVIRHLLAQPGAGAVQQPQAAQGVLHQVAHDPVRCEQLGHRWDVFGGHRFLAGHHFIFLFCDIELIEPAQQLHVVAVGVADRRSEARRD